MHPAPEIPLQMGGSDEISLSQQEPPPFPLPLVQALRPVIP